MNTDYIDADKGRARLQTRRLKSKLKRLMRETIPSFVQTHANENERQQTDEAEQEGHCVRSSISMPAGIASSDN